MARGEGPGEGLDAVGQRQAIRATVVALLLQTVVSGWAGLAWALGGWLVGIVLFAHGSGSGRFSPRNQFVARHLETGGFATLLMDLLTPDEADDRRKVFDIDLLADRLLLAERWLQAHRQTAGLQVGYFGASTGAGAALQAAAREPHAVGAIVSRGGRPDLAPHVGTFRQSQRQGS